jgi:ankyrin repeat protein
MLNHLFTSSCFFLSFSPQTFFQLGESPLHVASGNGFEDLVAFLLDRGCDAGVEDARGDTPLVWAARNGLHSEPPGKAFQGIFVIFF